jgi:hypothetical protein
MSDLYGGSWSWGVGEHIKKRRHVVVNFEWRSAQRYENKRAHGGEVQQYAARPPEEDSSHINKKNRVIFSRRVAQCNGLCSMR